MNIYESTEYVGNKEKEYLKLAVISQLDWTSKAVCYQTLKSLNTDVLISYKLEKYTIVGENQGIVEAIETLTPEMEEYLINKGYRVPKKEQK